MVIKDTSPKSKVKSS